MPRHHRNDFPQNYDQAVDILQCSRTGCRHGYFRFTSVRATKLRDERDPNLGRIFHVRYHATNVVTFLPGGRTVLRDGGWKTVTTKARMNACGFGVHVGAGGYWWVAGHLYVDGIVLDRNLEPIGVEEHWGIASYAHAVAGTAREIVGCKAFRRLDQPLQWRLLLLAMSDRSPEAVVA